MSRSRKWLLSSVIVLAAILIFPIGTCGRMNPPLAKVSKSGYRYDNLTNSNKNSDELFVVLTFSGGGTRAAALAYGVLLELANTPIPGKGGPRTMLDEVDVISSVSGGSLTAAYYGLEREKTFATFERDVLDRNITRSLVFATLRPDRLFKLVFTHYNRSDVAADVYEDTIFDGKTFADLASKGKPFVVINATDVSHGAPFEFTQAQFDLLCSDLSQFEIGRAVAASAAFPLLLTPIRVANHSGTCGFSPSAALRNAEQDRIVNPYRFKKGRLLRSFLDANARPWVHLVDGGIGDNLGLHTMIDSLNEDISEIPLRNLIQLGETKRIVIIAVDAGTEVDETLDRRPNTPGVVSVVSRSAFGPIDNYSFQLRDTIRLSMNHAQPEDTSAEMYLVHVSLDWVPDAAADLRRVPTKLHLPHQTVVRVRDAGRTILARNKQYQDFLASVRSVRSPTDSRPAG